MGPAGLPGERLLGDGRRTGHPAPARAGDEGHAGRRLRGVVEAVRRDHAVDARPAPAHTRQRRAQQRLRPAAQVIVGVLVHVEGERLVVLVRVADGEPAVKALHQQQLGLRPGRDRGLRRQAAAARKIVGRVVAQRIAIGQRGRQARGERLRLHHLQPHPAHRRAVPGGQVRSSDPAVRRTGAQDDQVTAVPGPGVVADGVGGQLDHLPARQPGVAGRAGRQVDAQHPEHLAGLDDRVPAAQETAGEFPAERGVDRPAFVRPEQLITPQAGVGQRRGLLEQAQFGLVGGEGQRRDGAEAGAGHLHGDLRPSCPGPQRELELGAGRPAADPDQPEIADARAAGDGLTLEVDDLVPASAGFQRVHHPKYATPDHHHPFHFHTLPGPGSRQSTRCR